MTISLQQLASIQRIDKLTVMAFEMSVYLVQVEVDNRTGMVCDQQQRPLRFFNLQSVRETFAEFDVAQTRMLQQTAYDEMCAGPAKSALPLELPFSLKSPY